MLSFKEFISEEMSVQPAFNLPRSQMPQIEDIDKFSLFIEEQGHSIIYGFDQVDFIRPTQHEFEQDKVDRIKESILSDESIGSIIISSDHFVIDGHHRYFAALQLNSELAFTQMSTNVADSLKLAMNFVETHTSSPLNDK